MNEPHTILEKLYGDHLRIRVCGIYIQEKKILLLKHVGVGKKQYMWIPPGGGMVFGQSVEENLKREFVEETGLKIQVKRFLFFYEYLQKPIHSIELFFEVKKIMGTLMLGKDPEMPLSEQIIQEIKFFSFAEIQKMDRETLHPVIVDNYMGM
ncbi:MAG: NUDIX domain-containing protein [Chitinophagaceae bacterium]|nr:NUDIX domain-containing protein [Chitinophagaceae bacterium]